MLFLNESYVIADHVETLVYQIYCDFKMAKMASDNGRITTIVHVQCISVINKKKDCHSAHGCIVTHLMT